MNSILSVGIDIGTTTTQLIFSRLTIQNKGAAFSVPEFAITEKEILYRSKIHFTPLRSDTVIDAEGVRKIIDEEYAASGISKADIRTGAIIITGETARKENARDVLNALSGYAGDFVVATAGPALESVLAGKGSGSQDYSRAHNCAVLNLDIGGGTTNLALFDCGRLVDTGCLNVGGRLMKFDEAGRVRYVSPVLRPFFTFPIGELPPPGALEKVTALLVRILEEAVGLREKSPELEHFITDKLPKLSGRVLLSFSGGVADLIEHSPAESLRYGDLGVLLGHAIAASALCREQYLRAKETIRATVIGAGSHTTELSGSTIFYDRVQFPLKNLPVAALTAEEEALPAAELSEVVRRRMAIFSPDGTPVTGVLALHGRPNVRFSELCKLADGVALGLRPHAEAGLPLIVAAAADMGKALGQAVGMLLPNAPLISLDGVRLPDGAYLDIGAPVAGGQVLPVVIKTLIL